MTHCHFLNFYYRLFFFNFAIFFCMWHHGILNTTATDSIVLQCSIWWEKQNHVHLNSFLLYSNCNFQSKCAPKKQYFETHGNWTPCLPSCTPHNFLLFQPQLARGIQPSIIHRIVVSLGQKFHRTILPEINSNFPWLCIQSTILPRNNFFLLGITW